MEESAQKEAGSKGGLKYKVLFASALGAAVLALGLMGVWVNTVSAQRSSLTEERDRLAVEKGSLEGEKAVLVSSIDSIEVERDSLVLENEDLIDEKDGLALARDLLTEEKVTLTEAKASLTIERDTLRSELKEARTQNDTLVQRLANTAGRVVSLTGDLNESQAQNGVLTQRVASAEDGVRSLTWELDQAQGDLEEAQSALATANSQIASFEGTSGELEAFQDSLQGYWYISSENILTAQIPFTSNSSLFPFIYVYSYRLSEDHVFTVLEDSSLFTTADISSYKIVEALTWDENSTSVRFQVDLSKGRANLSRGTYYMAFTFNFDTEYESFTYLDFRVK